MTTAPTTTELRAAFDRCRTLRFIGWTFDRACASPIMLGMLQHSAIAHRRRYALPVQERLI